jgi:hypothetical protein
MPNLEDVVLQASQSPPGVCPLGGAHVIGRLDAMGTLVRRLGWLG